VSSKKSLEVTTNVAERRVLNNFCCLFRKTQNFAKKVIFFTCNDNPHANQPMLQHDAIGKFKDLGKVEFNIVSFKEEFDFTKFYSVRFRNFEIQPL